MFHGQNSSIKKETFLASWVKHKLFSRFFSKNRDYQFFIHQKLIDSLHDTDFFIDGGANVGSVSRKALQAVSNPNLKIFAFEPDPMALVQLQSIHDPRIEILDTAIWINKSEKFLYRHKEFVYNASTTSSTLIASKSNVSASSGIAVKTIDISDFVKEYEPLSLIMKLDIEGAEYEVLNHLISEGTISRFNSIFCEYHPLKIRFGLSKHVWLLFRLLITKNSSRVFAWF